MLVKEIMSKNPVIVGPTAKLRTVHKLMKVNKIRHLPVIKNNELMGVITERDIRYAMIPEKIPGKKIPKGWNLDRLTVKDIMSRIAFTITQDTLVEDAAHIIYSNKIGALPVLNNGKLVGVVSAMDLLGIFIEMMGMLQSSSRIDVLMDKKQANLDKVSSIIRQNDGQIISVGISPYPKSSKQSIYMFRLRSCNIKPIVKKIKSSGIRIFSAV